MNVAFVLLEKGKKILSLNLRAMISSRVNPLLCASGRLCGIFYTKLDICCWPASQSRLIDSSGPERNAEDKKEKKKGAEGKRRAATTLPEYENEAFLFHIDCSSSSARRIHLSVRIERNRFPFGEDFLSSGFGYDPPSDDGTC